MKSKTGVGRPGSATVLTLLRLDLVGWWRYFLNPVLLAIGCTAALFGVRTASGASLVTSVLGGPSVTISPGGLTEVGGWSWLLIMGTYAVASGGTLKSGGARWHALELCRSGRRSRWVTGKLLAGMATSLGYVAALVAAVALGRLVSGSRVALVGHAGLAELFAVALALLDLAWSKLAIELIPGAATFGTVILFGMLLLAAFGGPLAPWIPFGQAIAGLHGEADTLNIPLGFAYGMSWAALCAAGSLYLAGTWTLL